jgi:hypothetical protein
MWLVVANGEKIHQFADPGGVRLGRHWFGLHDGAPVPDLPQSQIVAGRADPMRFVAISSDILHIVCHLKSTAISGGSPFLNKT